jgi:hypothetical protein
MIAFTSDTFANVAASEPQEKLFPTANRKPESHLRRYA